MHDDFAKILSSYCGWGLIVIDSLSEPPPHACRVRTKVRNHHDDVARRRELRGERIVGREVGAAHNDREGDAARVLQGKVGAAESGSRKRAMRG